MQTGGFARLAGMLAFMLVTRANAIAPAAWSSLAPDDITLVRLAGSSAYDTTLLNLLRLTHEQGAEICVPGSLDAYVTGTLDVAGPAALLACRAGRDSGLPPGRPLLLLKSAHGGAGLALAAMLRKGPFTASNGATLALPFLDPDSAALRSTPGVAGKPAEGLADFVLHAGIAPTALQLVGTGPDLVLSDLEPAQFRHAFQRPFMQAEMNALATLPLASTIFGVPLSRGLWQRLQALEFPVTHPCNPHHASYGDITDPASRANMAACMPSLGKAQVQGLLTGLLQDWSDLRDPLTGTRSLATITVPGLPDLQSSRVFVERASTTSGTQRAFEVVFNTGHCGEADSRWASTPGAATHEHETDAALARQLARRDANGQGAIGMLSTQEVAAGQDRWRFVKVAGSAPSLRHAVGGRWEIWFESSLHYRRSSVNGLPPAREEVRRFATQLATHLAAPGVIRALNTHHQQLFGRAGLMANGLDFIRQAPLPPLQEIAVGSGQPGDVDDRPVALVTRGESGTTASCASPVAIAPTAAEAD